MPKKIHHYESLKEERESLKDRERSRQSDSEALEKIKDYHEVGEKLGDISR